MYILFCTQKRRFFVLARDTVGGQGSATVHVQFEGYPAPEQLPQVEQLAERIKPHLEDTVVELYRRAKDASLADLRVMLSDQLYVITRKVKAQRNELESGFLEGYQERKRLITLETQQACLEKLLGLKKHALFRLCHLKHILLEENGCTACFGFDECLAGDIQVGFSFDEQGRIWMPCPTESAALAS